MAVLVSWSLCSLLNFMENLHSTNKNDKSLTKPGTLSRSARPPLEHLRSSTVPQHGWVRIISSALLFRAWMDTCPAIKPEWSCALNPASISIVILVWFSFGDDAALRTVPYGGSD